MNPRRKKRLILATTLIAGVGCVVALLLFALNSNLSLFYTPTEILQGKNGDGKLPSIGQKIRIGGMVTKGSVKRDDKSLKIQFNVHDANNNEVTVVYDGLLPDLFREEQGVVTQGVLSAPGTLTATEVLAKHDENYVPPEVAAAMGKTHKKMEYTKEQIAGK